MSVFDRGPRIGFGAMRLTGQPGNFGPYHDPDGGIALLRRAYELGVRHIDTARSYGPGHNEALIASAFDPYPEDLLIATKIGVEKPAPGRIAADGSPAAVRRGVRESLIRLRRDRLDLVYLHRPDPAVPIEESVGALADLVTQGLVAHVGVSNVTADQLARARSVTTIAAVENRYGPLERGDDVVVDTTAEQGIAYVPYGSVSASLDREPAIADVARERGLTSAQVALAWLLARGDHIHPIPGTTSIAHLEQNVAAAAVTLGPDELRRIDGSTA